MVAPWENPLPEGSQPAPGTLTPDQIHVLVLIERVGGSFSMLSIAILVTSYIVFKKLRTTPNLFLVLAGIANVCASVASVMGYDGLNQGKESTLCQAQAFIFQWFMQADPWWSFAMAVNVFLVFFYNINPNTLRQYAWVYCLICYGIPMLTAIILISIRNEPRGLIFGDAVLWCWIDSEWALVRIYAYYIPVWICIFLSIIIYIAVGYQVFHHRNQLKNMAAHAVEKDQFNGTRASSDGGDSAREALTRLPDSYGMAITEVQITSHAPVQSSKVCLAIPSLTHSAAGISHSRSIGQYVMDEAGNGGVPTCSQNFEVICSSNNEKIRQQTMISRLRSAKCSASLKLKRLDPVKMAYLRTSFIFAFAVLITWIPSSINRLYSLTHNNQVSFQLSVASGCVLPLQGVWNAIIYFTTSWKALSEEMAAVWNKLTGKTSRDRRGTIYIDEQMIPAARNGRGTFERTRAPNGLDMDSGQESQDEIEMRHYSRLD